VTDQLMDLTDQVFLVVGGGTNLGQTVAQLAAAHGAKVAVVVRGDLERAQGVVDGIIGDGGVARCYSADIADREALKAAATRIREELGELAAAVQCAAYRSVQPMETLAPDEWDRTVAVNLTGGFNLAQAVLPGMRARGYGRIVFVAGSVISTGMPPGHGHVAAAKSGLVGLARSIAKEFGCDGITANVVSPGVIDTPARPLSAEVLAELTAGSAIPRAADPREVAAACLFLASPTAAMVTGALIRVDGGMFS
jgi:NAD(P)-dependent dehydrogenase (short-subunit alcohol dehydrogenase family)